MAETTPQPNSARMVIQLLGGPDVVQKIVGIRARSQLWKWTAPKSAGGTGGVVPRRHWPKLRAYAAEQGIELPISLLAPELGDAS